MNRVPLKSSKTKPQAVRVAPSAHAKSRGFVSVLQLVGQGLGLFALATSSYLFFSHFVIQAVRVVGVSMLPTLRESDCCLVNRFAYLLSSPQRGDVVVLRDPTDDSYAVKRVIGVAGDKVDLRDGAVYVNGVRLGEPYLARGTQTFPFRVWEQVVQCGPDQFFVLGDNRFYSSDSRSYGVVSRSAILGLVLQ